MYNAPPSSSQGPKVATKLFSFSRLSLSSKQFSDPFWNSREESFWRHVFHLMTCWAVVCDIYYLSPQIKQKEESSVEFANRIKRMICSKANLTPVPWDGYLKHIRPSNRFVKTRRTLIARSLLRRFPELVKQDSSSSSESGNSTPGTLSPRSSQETLCPDGDRLSQDKINFLMKGGKKMSSDVRFQNAGGFSI